MQSQPDNAMTPEILRRRVAFDDAALLAECEIHIHRTGGPGGQHRNKVATAIRLIHKPSGIVATAGETRSQHENKEQAVARLREAIAIEARLPLPTPIAWPENVVIRDGRLRVSTSNPAYPAALALALDAIAAAEHNPADAAKLLGVSTSSLIRFVADHAKAWAAWTAIRKSRGLPPLRA